MKADKAITALGILTAVLSLLMFSVGRFIFGGIILLLAFGIFWNRGGGTRNDRSIYEKVVKSDLSIDEIYERIRDIETPLGRPWIGGHKGFDGDCIVFGPCRFNDCVVISPVKGRKINIKHVTRLENILIKNEDEYRFEGMIDSENTEVTPAKYAVFAGFKLASVMMVRHMTEIVEQLTEDRSCTVPQEIDMYRFYFHNSSYGCFRDSGERDVLRVETDLKPFRARVLDADGNLMAEVIPRGFDPKGDVAEREGFELRTGEGHFGEIRRFRDRNGEGYIADTDAGEFRVTLFPACMKARLSCNYMIEKNGQLKAVIGGSPNILFDTEGWCRNDIIDSFDDDYLVLYAVLETFILTLNSKFLK